MTAVTEILQESLSLTPGARVFGVSGSPRRQGNSDILLERVLKGVRDEGIGADRFNLTRMQFSGCIGCERCRKDLICTGLVDGMSLVYRHLIEARGVVLVSPTHNYNITAWMKAFIDRLYCFYTFTDDRPRSWSSRLAGQGRKAVLAAVCEQEDEADMGFTIAAMKTPLEALGYEIVGELAVFKVFDKGLVKEDARALDDACELGSRLARAIA